MRQSDESIPEVAGDFAWMGPDTEGVRRLILRLPCGHPCALPVNTEKGWQWNRNDDAPTLTPSILCLTPRDGTQCGWHGYMTGGEIRPC